MKRLLTLLALCLLLTSSLAAASGAINGTVYMPNTERGMHIAKGEAGAGMIWDMSAPKNRKSSERAEIWLVDRSIDFAALPYAAVQKWYQEGVIPEGQPIDHTVADEQGKFDFKHVPAADYYIVILDPHGQEKNLTLTEKMSRDELLKKLPHSDEFELFMVGMRNCLVQKVTLHSGQTLNIRPGVL